MVRTGGSIMQGKTLEDHFYTVLGWVIVVPLLPILVPLGLYIGLTYHWTDTVPKEDDE